MPGSGLGLAIVKQVVSLGGMIRSPITDFPAAAPGDLFDVLLPGRPVVTGGARGARRPSGNWRRLATMACSRKLRAGETAPPSRVLVSSRFSVVTAR